MNASSQKKLPRSKPPIDSPYSPQSRILHVKSQQNLLDRTGLEQIKIEQTLMKQIQQAREIINKYNGELDDQVISKVAPLINEECIRLLYEMEHIIEVKNKEIQGINQEINLLRNSPNQGYRETGLKFKSAKNVQFYRLSDEILQQKQELLLLQKQHKRKKKQLNENKRIMKETADANANLITIGNKRILTYQQYVAKRQRSRQEKEDSNQKSRRLTRKNIQSIKDSVQNEEDKKNAPTSTNLRDAENKKKIADSALRGLKRKHQMQMNELNSKLEFLRDENQELDYKLKQKIQQLKSAEMRFSQTKQVSQSKKILKQVRYSEPQL